MGQTEIYGDITEGIDNVQSGLNSAKPVECKVGDVWVSTDNKKMFACFVTNTWTHINPVNITGASDGDLFQYDGTTGFLVPAGPSGITPTTRVTTTYQMLSSDDVIFADTDGGAFTITLVAGSDGRQVKIINCGTSSNKLTIDGNGTETIHGELTQELKDEEVLDLTFNSTEGWL